MSRINNYKSNKQRAVSKSKKKTKKTTNQTATSKQKSFHEIVCEMENREYTQYLFIFIVCVLKEFSDTAHRLTTGEICRYINGIFIDYGETAGKRKELEKKLKAVENKPDMDDDQKEKELQRIRKGYYDKKIDSMRRTVKNRLNHYFTYSEKIRSFSYAECCNGEDYEDYVEYIDALLFPEGLMKTLFGGFICREKRKRGDVYWFESILDDADLKLIVKALNADCSLTNAMRQFLLYAVSMTMLPSLEMLRESDCNKESLLEEDADLYTQLDLDYAKRCVGLWDEYVESKLYATDRYDDAA